MTIYKRLSYLDKHRFKQRQISIHPDPNLGMVIVIPCFFEFELIQTLDSLRQCTAPAVSVELIIVINASQNTPSHILHQNVQTSIEVENWIQKHRPFFSCHYLLLDDLPPKHAGVGLARKIGMDEAVDRFEQLEKDNGIIICLDADTTVQHNYLIEIEAFFNQYPRKEALSIHFEHPLEGEIFEERVYTGITHYELFLRYYIEALRYAGYPFAFHTIGSAMAVRSKAYQKRGGMNRRKAGEDFYFLHKFISQNSLGELNSSWVIPSPRASEKVPFGTGRAIKGWLESTASIYPAYHPQIFEEMRQFIGLIPELYYAVPFEKIPSKTLKFLIQKKNSRPSSILVGNMFHLKKPL